jgi:hypothetical protein
MAKEPRTPPSAKDMQTFIKDQLSTVKKLQDDVLKARERLRNKTGALRDAQNDLMNGLAEGFQLKLHFGPEEEIEDEAEPEDLKATG